MILYTTPTNLRFIPIKQRSSHQKIIKNLIKNWNKSEHSSMLFGIKVHAVYFIAINRDARIWDATHGWRHLKRNLDKTKIGKEIYGIFRKKIAEK